MSRSLGRGRLAARPLGTFGAVIRHSDVQVGWATKRGVIYPKEVCLSVHMSVDATFVYSVWCSGFSASVVWAPGLESCIYRRVYGFGSVTEAGAPSCHWSNLMGKKCMTFVASRSTLTAFAVFVVAVEDRHVWNENATRCQKATTLAFRVEQTSTFRHTKTRTRRHLYCLSKWCCTEFNKRAHLCGRQARFVLP